MNITIGTPDPATNEVPVTITVDGEKYKRTIRAVMTDGKYDRAATKTRAEEVARGYPAKIAAGVVMPARLAAAAPPPPAE